ncbi:hypothetical protein ACU6RQ_18705 [Zobellella denitrificans]
MPPVTRARGERLGLLTDYYRRVLNRCRSTEHELPLLADGIDTRNGEPVRWHQQDGRRPVVSNFASQQNFLRGLVAMSVVTGEAGFQQAADDLTRCMLERFRDPVGGLLYWGGHRFVERDGLTLEGPQGKHQVHELKHHFPFYEQLHRVDPDKALALLRGFWQAHVDDWAVLDLSRHGEYGRPAPADLFRRHRPVDVVDPARWPELPETRGLTFVNAGTDLIYAACHYARYSGDGAAAHWAKHLYRQYVLARPPGTGLPVYQFSSPLQREPVPDDDRLTYSWFGDRARRQFGPEFGAIAREANVLFRDSWPVVVDSPLAMLEVARLLDDRDIARWAADGVLAYFRHAWDPEHNLMRPLWSDGTDLSGHVLRRPGYYGEAGTVLAPWPADPACLLPLLRAALQLDDPELAALAARFFARLGLGELEAAGLGVVRVNTDTDLVSPYLLFALLELYQAGGDGRLWPLLERLGENLLAASHHRGWFLPSARHRFARIDELAPFALAGLEAAGRGCFARLPRHLSNGGYLHGERLGQGRSRTCYDREAIYDRLLID